MDEEKKINAKTRKASPTELTPEVLDYISETQRIYPMAPDERRERYKDERTEEFLITAAKTEKEKEREESTILKSAAATEAKQILYGEVIGHTVSRMKDQSGKVVKTVYSFILQLVKDPNHPEWEDYENKFNRILIPFEFFLFYNMDRFAGKDGERLQTIVMSSCIGAIVPFVVVEYNEESRVAIASRILAASSVSHKRYRVPVKPEDGIGEAKPKLRAGMRTVATILSAQIDRVIVDVSGAQCVIRNKELDHIYIPRVNQKYRPGQRINVRILEVGEEEVVTINGQKYYKQNVVCSKKACDPDPADIYYDQFNEGDRVQATITSENGGDGTYIWVVLRGRMNARCKMTNGSPAIGSTCIVEITHKFDDKKQILGKIDPNSIQPPRATDF